jgi:hypothetical protein
MKKKSLLFGCLILAIIVFIPLSALAQDEEILSELNEQIVQVPMVLDSFFGKKEVQS